MIHVRHAAAAMTSRRCQTVLITHGESGAPASGAPAMSSRLAVRRLDRLREHGVEFSLLTDAFEDSGAGLVQLAQIV